MLLILVEAWRPVRPQQQLRERAVRQGETVCTAPRQCCVRGRRGLRKRGVRQGVLRTAGRHNMWGRRGLGGLIALELRIPACLRSPFDLSKVYP